MNVNILYEISELSDLINSTNNKWHVDYKLASGVFDVVIYKQYTHKPKIRLIAMFWIIDDISQSLKCIDLLQKIINKNTEVKK